MKKYAVMILLAMSGIIPLQAQHSVENEYRVVGDRILKAIDSKDFSEFRMSVEQAGLELPEGEDAEHEFWTIMRNNIKKMPASEGWEEIAQYQVADRYFMVSYIYYTNSPRFFTFRFLKVNNLWVLNSFDYQQDFDSYVKAWGFMLNDCACCKQRAVESESGD